VRRAALLAAVWAGCAAPGPAEEAAVERVYPTADRLPANLLRFYIHFSKPMREEREVFDRIRLLGDDGKEVPDPWRRVELWNEEATRLTLLLHPGRVKLGVALREAMGPVLQTGRAYTLEIGSGLLDAGNRPLGRAFAKRFTAVEDDRSRPAVADWKLGVPRAGTREPLVAAFPEPLDRWLLERCVRVLDGQGTRVPGRLAVGAEERSVSFTPERAWPAGACVLELDDALEDLAGNSPARLFEEDLSAPSLPVEVRRTFRIAP
jgi:hypothetical protein